MGHFPAGASVQSILHYAQIINTDVMPLYDWGSASANNAKYGQDVPPDVELGKITLPTAMFVGSQDDLGDVKDNRWAKSQMGPALKYYQEVSGGHATFLVGNEVAYLDKVLSLVAEYKT